MDPDHVYRDCIADIEGITSLFDGAECRDIQLARERLRHLKARWHDLILRFKGTEIDNVVEEAATRLPNANTRPCESWLQRLCDAEGDFNFRLNNRT